jgi:predicted nucleic acid-binding protein
MTLEICMDTGVITQYFSKDPPTQIIELFKTIKAKNYQVYLTPNVLMEAYVNLAKLTGGTDYAEQSISSFMHKFQINIINFDQSLIFKASKIKTLYPHVFSYVDCSLIAFSLNNKITLHTTDKEIKKKFPQLKIITYNF